MVDAFPPLLLQEDNSDLEPSYRPRGARGGRGAGHAARGGHGGRGHARAPKQWGSDVEKELSSPSEAEEDGLEEEGDEMVRIVYEILGGCLLCSSRLFLAQAGDMRWLGDWASTDFFSTSAPDRSLWCLRLSVLFARYLAVLADKAR